MKTPIYDFVRAYGESGRSRFHMPGHKGREFLGIEGLDVTEISGADVLYDPSGIIEESENNATVLFGSRHTYYGTEGSTQCIKAMLTLAANGEEKPLFLAARNVHKAFIYGVAMLDGDVKWLLSEGHICHSKITPKDVEEGILSLDRRPSGVYITSPDYLGNVLDVRGIADVCKKHGVPLLVDNAHGAYTAFLKENKHPIALGATMCCDSAHKTLPALTGGAYLHVGKSFDVSDATVREALATFSSTSPSYLILESLDLCNKYISDGYCEKLSLCAERVSEFKRALLDKGFFDESGEQLKIAINAKRSGYTGEELNEILFKLGGVAEFYDEDYLVLMITPENDGKDFLRLYEFLDSFSPKEPIKEKRIALPKPRELVSIRRAVLGASEFIEVEKAEGRICASPTVSCPPAVPIAISGEEITKAHIEAFIYYGINKISVLK